jgi:hypothetical protein
MEIETKYAVSIFFNNPSFIQIYFEAVANALDAGASEIDVFIDTDGDICPKHLEITIKDNGDGFTEERFNNFSRLQKPKDTYHKGLGRLIYLQYFSKITIESVFGTKKRTFMFSDTFKGQSDVQTASASDFKGTILRFSGFIGNRLKSYEDIKPGPLKDKLVEQFLPYFYNMQKAKRDFQITIQLETQAYNKQKDFYSDLQKITISDVPQFETKIINDISIHAFGEITMSYMLRQGMGENIRLTAVCIDGRTIPIKELNLNIPPNHSSIFLFESPLFNGKSDSARQRLVLPDDIPQSSLFNALKREMSAVINERFPAIQKRNDEIKQNFENIYPHLSGLFEENTVGMIDKDEAIEIAQRKFFKLQKEVLESTHLDDITFNKSLEVSSRTLTEYVLYRELIIKKMRSITPADKEKVLHDLLVPRFKTFHGSALLDGIYCNNAWLLDDKFMSFRTILSEKTMEEVITAITLGDEKIKSNKRPDISMIFSADPKQTEKVDVVVVEVKRRTADDKEAPYAATQLVQRAEKLAEHCPNIQRIWYFGVIEIDDALAKLLHNMGWTPLYSKGKVFYNDSFKVQRGNERIPAPICLLSYDAVIEDAAARNHTFLEVLKQDIRKAKVEQVGTR